MNDKIDNIKSVVTQQAQLHLFAFVVWLHVLVFLKWDSDIRVPNDIVATPWYESQEYHERYDQLVRLNEEHEKSVVKMQSLQNRFNAVSKAIEKILLEHDQHELDSANNQLGQLLFAESKEGSFHTPIKLRQLLEQVNLEDSYPLENSLRPAFREATAELQLNMELGASNVDWRGLQSELKSIAIPERPLVEVLPGSCDAMTNREMVDAASLTEEDLSKRIQHIRDLAAKRWKALQDHGDDAVYLPFSFDTSLQRQQTNRAEMLTDLEAMHLQIVKEHEAMKMEAESDDISTGQCVKSQNVLPWLEDGLKAYFRGHDPRQAILRRVLEAYPAADTSKVLIDLPPFWDESGKAHATPANLRQLLDGPLIVESARGINAIIDSMGGYSDLFDQYIDGLGVDDVGTVILQTLMQRAGSVKLPSMPNVLDMNHKASTTR